MLKPPIPGLEGDIDEHFKDAVELVVQYERASPSLLQRRLSIGYARAARLIDQLEAAGVLGPAEGATPREVLINSPEEMLEEKWKQSSQKHEDPFEAPANYKVPIGLKLNKVDNIPWGKQFSDVIKIKDFIDSKAEYPVLLGFDDAGKLYSESLLDIKNLIIVGNALSQKENLVDTILLTYLLRYMPHQLRIILSDPTHYLDLYDGIPHLLSPVINDYYKVISTFRWSLSEMDRRMKQFALAGVRDINSYNQLSGGEAIPKILLVTFLTLPDIETADSLTTLTGQGARTGIHNIIIIDRTNGRSLPTNIKSNIPARAVFRLTSSGESKAIDVVGAEKLESGEILYKPNFGATVKLDAIFTPEVNVKEVVEAVKKS